MDFEYFIVTKKVPGYSILHIPWRAAKTIIKLRIEIASADNEGAAVARLRRRPKYENLIQKLLEVIGRSLMWGGEKVFDWLRSVAGVGSPASRCV